MPSVPPTRPTLDLELLLRLRVVVARYGEMDLARWWNTTGQLGPWGAKALARGFPRTHNFAQARSVFAVAANVCHDVPDSERVPRGCVSLWRLPDAIEEELELRWEHWLDHADAWRAFFEKVAELSLTPLAEILQRLELVGDADLAALAKLKRTAEGRAIALPSAFTATDATVRLLALGFARGEPGALAVPYARRVEK